MGFVKEKWTEDEVLNLPEGEHNYFDRKSGKLFADKTKLYETLAKALSAFANSGGGHLILGQEDDGTVAGVPAMEGRTPIREWLEQKLPGLLSYPLESFRVHTVVRHPTASKIPTGKELVVVDVGDSRLAPHQACFPPDRPQYYYRQGGKSVAAPHHYLEALRNRITAAVLDVSLKSISFGDAHIVEGNRAIVELRFQFEVRNVSRLACYKWDVISTIHDPNGDGQPLVINETEFPPLRAHRSGISIDTTLLPTFSAQKHVVAGFKYVGSEVSLHRDIPLRLLPMEVHYHAVSENHIGEMKVTRISDVTTQATLVEGIARSIRNAGVNF